MQKFVVTYKTPSNTIPNTVFKIPSKVGGEPQARIIKLQEVLGYTELGVRKAGQHM